MKRATKLALAATALAVWLEAAAMALMVSEALIVMEPLYLVEAVVGVVPLVV